MEEFALLVEKLRRGDPEITRFDSLDDMDELSLTDSLAYRLGEALLGNDRITDLLLSGIGDLTAHGEYHPLLNAIQSSKSLRSIHVACSRLASISHRFIRSIAHNNGIEEVSLKNMVVGADSLSLLLCSATSMRTLTMTKCVLEARNGFDNQDVVTDLIENQSLLCLDVDFEGGMFRALHQGIVGHSTLRRLSLNGERGIDNTQLQEIRAILESPKCSLQTLQFDEFIFGGDFPFDVPRVLADLAQELLTVPRVFAYLAQELLTRQTRAELVQGILACQMLTKLTLNRCSFDIPSAQELLSIYHSETSNVRTLTILGCVDGCSLDFCNLLKQCPYLKEFSLFADQESYDWNFSNLLTLLEGESPVEKCTLSGLNDPTCRTLVQILPGMIKVKELSLFFCERPTLRKEIMLRAFEKNNSLVKLNLDYEEDYYSQYEHIDEDYHFLEADLAKIRLYTERNKLLPQLLRAPTSEVPLSLRPRLFSVAKPSQSGPSLIFQSLLRLGAAIGQEEVKQSLKRRRITQNDDDDDLFI